MFNEDKRFSHSSTTSMVWYTPNGIRLLLVINCVVFLLTEFSGFKFELFQMFGLVPSAIWQSGRIWQPITYLFMHGGFLHLVVNLFVLWMFGRELERRWGEMRFLRYYFITGLGAGLVTCIFQLNSVIPVVGASGAIYGVLLAFGLLYPDRKVYLYFIVPIKMKYFIGILAAVAFFASLSPGESPVSHLTHLSGMVIGFIYLHYWPQKSKLAQRIEQIKVPVKIQLTKQKLRPNGPGKVDDTLLNRRVDQVLDKMKQVGWDGLSESEQSLLFQASKRSLQDQPPS